jgi:hypothetical protein
MVILLVYALTVHSFLIAAFNHFHAHLIYKSPMSLFLFVLFTLWLQNLKLMAVMIHTQCQNRVALCCSLQAEFQ